jgi:hypothetical protein
MPEVTKTMTEEKECRIFKKDLIKFFEENIPELLDESSLEGKVWYSFAGYSDKYLVAKNVDSILITRTVYKKDN